MQIDEDLWADRQYEILVRFIHHLGYFRILGHAYTDLQIKSEFWKYTIDAHILRAIIDWCMVFGTDSNELHWKKVALNDCTQSAFRNYLLTEMSLTLEQWSECRSNMMEFRNRYAAHSNIPYPPTPTMDLALGVVTTYDDWFRNSIDETFDEPSLQQRYERLMRTSLKPLTHAVSLGPTVEKEYEDHSINQR
jgi:hypothetical protein